MCKQKLQLGNLQVHNHKQWVCTLRVNPKHGFYPFLCPLQLTSLPGGVVVFGNKKRLSREAVKHKLDARSLQHTEVVSV
jgi:hypothetical protein